MQRTGAALVKSAADTNFVILSSLEGPLLIPISVSLKYESCLASYGNQWLMHVLESVADLLIWKPREKVSV